jgi:hypothetical protein
MVCGPDAEGPDDAGSEARPDQRSQRCSRSLSLGTIVTVGEPSFHVFGGDGPKRFRHRFHQGLVHAGGRLLQKSVFTLENASSMGFRSGEE